MSQPTTQTIQASAYDPGKPLAGIQVVDLTHVLAGPICTYQFALLGAEVIKVENPDNCDMYRGMGADKDLAAKRMGTLYLGHSANKKAVALNLKDPRGLAALNKLIASADVLVQNFRPGAAERLGLGYDDCRRINPRLVYCAISGYGQTGPYADRPAVDHVIQGAAGVMAVTGPQEGPGMRIGYAAADTAAGFLAGLATLGALVGAIRSGQGCFVDVSMLEACVLAQGPVYYDYVNTGYIAPRVGPYGITRRGAGGAYQTQDGKEIVFSALSYDQFKRFCKAVQREDLLADPRFGAESVASSEHANALRAILKELMATRTAKEWEDRLLAAGVPVGMSNSVPEVAAHPQLASRRAFTRFDHPPGLGKPLTVQNAGYHINGAPVAPQTPPPRVGEHTASVLKDLGYSEDDIKAMFRDGVAYSDA